jgi:broad specificity phosphatase PhoE
MSPARLPHRIFIIRHAEKPDTGDSPHLSDKGRLRAGALPRYPLPTLAGIYAARTSPESARPVETVTPLAAASALAINAEIKNKDFPRLVGEVLSGRLAGKDLLICWHHEEIPHLTRSLGVNLTHSYKWPDVYDRIWVVTYLKDGTPTFEDRPQRLLPGDSAV